ncbi:MULTISPECIES: DNA alkylation repair protein [Thioclava]|uniref:DNA alkylation repair protein n=1 Tax=Thioclava TaxID=285107 RepID=UPI000C3D0AE9|nr:DNA alkylation repair protein [Thioclava sp.]|tara:strand:+ start:1604 stop:2455 length:852 start_codon:yes stop_codon:yes gene_type:complete
MSRKRGKKRVARPRASDYAPLDPAEDARLRAEAEAYAASDADYKSFAEEDDTDEPLGPPPTLEDALFALESWADAEKAAEMAAYHKAERRYLGVSVPAIEDMVALWRGQLDVPGRVELARGLWDSDIHEARIAAAKLLTQARLRPDAEAWDLIASWVPQFDAWAIADHAAKAGSKRLQAEPARLDEVADWVRSDHMWTRRAAFVFTLPWTKQRNPKPEDEAVRDEVLGWAAQLAEDRDWFIQKAIAWWLRELSKKDPARAQAWLTEHGERLKPFARKEASKYL